MPYGEDITINVGDTVRIHPNYKGYKFKKLKFGVTYIVKEVDSNWDGKVRQLETEQGGTLLLNMDKRYFEHVGKEEEMERNYQLEIGDTEDSYSLDHYNLYYTLTEKDIEAGKIKVDAYWVAKQWKTGSRDDSGALWHSLKTIARFGEKNDKAREIKALYNQALALARIYDVEL